jgi:hypothetical protein
MKEISDETLSKINEFKKDSLEQQLKKIRMQLETKEISVEDFLRIKETIKAEIKIRKKKNLESARISKQEARNKRFLSLSYFLIQNGNSVPLKTIEEWYLKTYNVTAQTFYRDLSLLKKKGDITKQTNICWINKQKGEHIKNIDAFLNNEKKEDILK